MNSCLRVNAVWQAAIDQNPLPFDIKVRVGVVLRIVTVLGRSEAVSRENDIRWRGLAEARTQYQLRCAPSNQQQLTPFTPQQVVPSQAPVLPAPAPAAAAPARLPLEAQAPPKPSYRSSSGNAELRMKKAAKAAPAKAKAADAKSSDAVY